MTDTYIIVAIDYPACLEGLAALQLRPVAGEGVDSVRVSPSVAARFRAGSRVRLQFIEDRSGAVA
jgi:hypothetical protein